MSGSSKAKRRVLTSTALVLTLCGYEDGNKRQPLGTQLWVCFVAYARSSRLLLAMEARNGAKSLACICVSTAFSAMQNRTNMPHLLQRSMLYCRVVILDSSIALKQGHRSVKKREAVINALRSLYFLVKHSLPHTTLFSPFLDFCILQGCGYLSNPHLAGNAHYRSDRVIQEFLEELGSEVFTTLLSKLKESPYIALMADETTDIEVTKELILYARYIVPSATPQHCVGSIFLWVSELSDGKADTITPSILEFLTSLDLSITKVMGFGSDGASVMVG